MEQSFKNKPWPFVPECLSEIISEDVLRIIQTGISLKEKIPLLIIEFRDGKAREIEPIKELKRIGFCEKFRTIQLQDGTRPGDETCKICDYDAVRKCIEEGERDVRYRCIMGIIKLRIPILVANKVVAVLFGGQIIHEPDKAEEGIPANLREWSNGKCPSDVSKECLVNLKNILEIAKQVPKEVINELAIYIINETIPDIPKFVEERKKLVEGYVKITANLANTIYSEYKRAQEQEFFHKIASIFDTSEVINIEKLKKTVSEVLDKICKFCGASSAILFANQERGSTTLPIFASANIEVENIYLNPEEGKEEGLSKSIIVKDLQKCRISGADAEKIKGSILLPVVGKRDEYRISLALHHPSPNTVINESTFFNNLSRTIAGGMSIRLQEIGLAKRYENFSEETTNVAHDFLIGLQPITTWIERWLTQCKKRTCLSMADQAHNTIDKAVDRLTGMVRDTLSLHKIEEVTGPVREYISLESIIWECVEFMRPEARKKGINIKINDKSISYLSPVLMEKRRFFRAIRNILDNAIKYSFDNTEIRISSWSDPYNNFVVFSNFGIGVLPDEKERVFERDHRGRRALEIKGGRGRGIGLSEAREIMREHRCDITLESRSGERRMDSKMGEGYVTKVTISLPAEKIE